MGARHGAGILVLVAVAAAAAPRGPEFPADRPTDATAVISRYCASLAQIKPTIMKSAISTSMIAPVIAETRNTSPRDRNCIVRSHSPKKRPLHPRRKPGAGCWSRFSESLTRSSGAKVLPKLIHI